MYAILWLITKRYVVCEINNFAWFIFRYEKAVIAMAKQTVTLEVLSKNLKIKLHTFSQPLKLKFSIN